MRIMSTLKLLFSKITDDAPVYEKKDVVENICVSYAFGMASAIYICIYIKLPGGIYC